MEEITIFLETNYSIDAVSFLLQRRLELYGNKQEQQKHIVEKIILQTKSKFTNAKESDIKNAIFEAFDFLDYK